MSRVRIIIFLCLLLSNSVLVSSQAVSQETLSFYRLLSPRDYHQTFQAPMSGTVSQIDVYIFNGCWGSYTAEVDLYDGSGITGTLLANGGSFSGGNCVSGWQSFALSSPSVVSGNTYTIRLRATSGTIAPEVAGGNVYTNGSFINSNFPANDDIGFRVFMATPLPVEMTAVTTSQLTNGSTLLKWTTLSEKNNSHFEILRSEDSFDFHTIGTVEGNGTISYAVNYSFVDPIINKNEFTYYKIKQVDYDGEESYSNIVTVINSMLHPVDVSPNPFTNYIEIYPHAEHDDHYYVEIRNLEGELIYNYSGQLFDEHRINTEGFKTGFYILKVIQDRVVSQSKIVKL